MIAYKVFVQTLREQIWPDREARSLFVVHTNFFISAMMQLQRDFEILRQNNTDIFPFGTRMFDCWKTVIGCPWGAVNQVYTVSNGDFCDRVYYRQCSYEQILVASRDFAQIQGDLAVPPNTGLPALPSGIRYEETSTDLIVGEFSMRARTGLYAIHNKRLYVYPWLQSNEWLVVDWKGLKSTWKPDDPVDDVYWHAGTQRLVKLHVKLQHENDFGEDPRKAAQVEREYDILRTELLADERENTWLRHTTTILEGSYIPTRAQVDAQVIPEVVSGVTFAAIADSGENDANQDAVAALLESNVQDFLIISGDLSYGGAYADVVTAKYPSYPTIIPARGNHDYDINNGADYETFFAALENNGVLHEYVNGPLHILSVPSDPREPGLGYIDATTSIENGPIGQYIKAKFLLSPATWKFLSFHHASYSSGSSHGNSLWMDMDFPAMGLSGKIDGILMGHNHNFEVAIKNGIRYITNGLGGRAKNGFGAPVAGSVFRYFADYGALFNTVNATTWHYEFRNTSGTVVYQEDVTK